MIPIPNFDLRSQEEKMSASRTYSMLDAENRKEMYYENLQCAVTGIPVTRCPICNGLRKHPLIQRVCTYCGAEMEEEHHV